MVSSTIHAPPDATSPLPRLLRWAGALVGIYALTWAATHALWGLTAGPMGVEPRPLPAEATVAWTVGFFLFFTPLLYLVPCALAGRWLRPNAKTLALYIGVGYAMGCTLEMTIAPLWQWVFGRPLYVYHLAPIHAGHTSATGVVMWAMYGFFVGMMHQSIAESPRLGFMRGIWPKAALLAVDAMILEVAANIFSLWGYHSWLFRYHAPDLAHFTTAEVFPMYLVGGALGVWFLHHFETHPRRHVLGAVLYAVVLVAAFGLDGHV